MSVGILVNAQRDRILLDGTWGFAPDDAETGPLEEWYRPGTPFPQEITVPGCWQAQGKYCHKAWYRRQVTVLAAWRGKRVALKFGGVSFVTDVWSMAGTSSGTRARSCPLAAM